MRSDGEHCCADEKCREGGILGVIFDNIFCSRVTFGGKDTEIPVRVRDSPEGLLEISVSNTGPGIPEAKEPLIVDRFAQDIKTRSSDGLSLHVVNMLMESYSGTVWTEERVAD
jgi:two-component system sensor histidine kinase ChvG